MKPKKILVFSAIIFTALGCNKDIEVSHSKIKNQKDEINLQLESQKEKFVRGDYSLEEILFSDGTSFDGTIPLNFNVPNETTTNYFLSKNLDYLENEDFDKDGVLIRNNNYHPTAIAKLALKTALDYKKTGSKKSKNIFDNQLKWVVENFHQKDNYGMWFFPFAFPSYHLKEDWSSAYAHGLLLSTLIEAYNITEDEMYKSLIEKAVKAYLVPIEYGGFKREWNSGEWWFEEYATDKPSRVLNGFIFSLECLYNTHQDLKIPLAKKLFDEGSKTLLSHLESFDAKYSSRYNLADWKDQISKENYHEIHTIQLLWMYKATGNIKFKKYSKRFFESDRHNFLKGSSNFNLPKKVKQIKASHTIDSIKYGVENLNNEIWSYGKFWSSYKTTELIIDYGKEVKNVNALSLYHVTNKSKNVNFEIYRLDDKTNDWVYVEKFSPKFNKDKISVYNKTGKFETFVEHFKIHEDLYGKKIKIIFHATNDNIIALRNINFIYDRQDNFDYLLDVTDKRIKRRKLK